MAHILCRVVHSPESITLVWSQGTQFFEPYTLTGGERERFEQFAQQGRQLLAQGGPATDVASTGYALHELLLQGSVGQEVRGWLAGQGEGLLEVVSNAPERVPFNIVRDHPGDDPQRAWGVRYGLTQGRSVGALRLRPYIQDAQVLLVVDPVWEAALTEEGRNKLKSLAPSAVRSLAELRTALRGQAPDFVILAGRVEGESFLLDADRLRTSDLSRMLGEAESGSAAPIVFLLGETVNAPAWACFLAGANRQLPGVITFDVPTSAAVQLQAAAGTLQRLLQQRQPLGEAMRGVRRELGATGLTWSAYCPPHVRVVQPGDPLEPTGLRLYPLPKEPFHPLRPLDREERSLLVGRDHDIGALGRLVDQAETRGVLLHGGAGVGKASLLRAGLLPHLEEGPGYWVLRDRREAGREEDLPTLALRPGRDLTAQIAEALCSFAARPYVYTTPTGRTVTVDLPGILREFVSGNAGADDAIQDRSRATVSSESTPSVVAALARPEDVWRRLSQNPQSFAALWKALTSSLPREIVLAIEHGEDLAAPPQDAGSASARLLTELAAATRGKFVMSVRSELISEIQELLASSSSAPWLKYRLDDLHQRHLRSILELPALTQIIPHSTQVPAQVYDVRFDDLAISKLVQRATDTARLRNVNPTTMLHVAAAELYGTYKRQITLRMVQKFPFEEALTQWIADKGRTLSLASRDRRSLAVFLGSLWERGPGGMPIEPLYPLNVARSRWSGREPFESLLPKLTQPEVGLIQVHQTPSAEGMQVTLGLAHHGMTALNAETAEKVAGRRYSWKAFIDSLFVFVPLILLAVAVTIFFYRRHASRERVEYANSIQDEVRKLSVQSNNFERDADGLRDFALNSGLPLAEQALRHGDSLRTRQLLLGYQPTREKFDDRSFAWFYLWKQIHAETHSLQGQREGVTAVATSADGKIVAIADAVGILRLWNMKDKPEVGAELRGEPARIQMLAFSPDSKEIAAACADGTVRLWPTTLGDKEPVRAAKEARRLGKHAGPVLCLAYTPDGKLLVSGGLDRKAIVWDVETGKEKGQIEVETPVPAVAVSPDGKSFAAAAGKKAVFADLASAKKSKDIDVTADGRVESLAYVSDTVLALGTSESYSGEEQGRLHLWDLKADKDTSSILDHGNGITTLGVWRDKGIVLTAGKDHVVRLWHAKDAKELRTVHGHLGAVRSLAVAEKTGLLATAAHDNAVKIFDLTTLLLPENIAAHKGGARSLAFAPDGKFLASGGKDGLVKFWSPTSNQPLGQIKLDAPVTALEFTLHEKELVLATGTWAAPDKGEVKLWKITSEKDKVDAAAWQTLSGISAGVRGLAFDPAGKRIAVSTGEPTIWIGGVAKGEKQSTLTTPNPGAQPLVVVRFDPVRALLFAGDRSGNICVWDTAADQFLQRIATHGDTVRGIALQSLGDFTSFCTIGDDMRFSRAMRDKSGSKLALKDSFRTNQFSHAIAAGKDRVLAIGDEAGVLTIFDLHFDRVTLKVAGHDGPVRAVAVSPDQKLVASAGDDGVLRFFRGDVASKPPTPINFKSEEE